MSMHFVSNIDTRAFALIAVVKLILETRPTALNFPTDLNYYDNVVQIGSHNKGQRISS